MRKPTNLFGQTFGLLAPQTVDDTVTRPGVYWDCLCACGNRHTVRANSLTMGTTKSCGCIKPGPKPKWRRVLIDQTTPATASTPATATTPPPAKLKINAYWCPFAPGLHYGYAITEGLETGRQSTNKTNRAARPGPYGAEVHRALKMLVDNHHIPEMGARRPNKWLEDCGIVVTEHQLATMADVDKLYVSTQGST